MERVAVIMTQAIENNSSSMIRAKNIVNALKRNNYQLFCYCPYPDIESKYYKKESGLLADIVIRRYGNVKAIKPPIRTSNTERKSLKHYFILLAYRLFKRFDVFGSSLQYLRYKKSILKMVRMDTPDILVSFSDPMTAHIIGGYCKKKLKIKYVQQWGDPLATDTIAKTSLPKWVRYHIEKALLRPADRVCYVSPLTLEEQQVLFKKQAKKMVFLPTPSVEYSNSTVTANRITIGYYGSYNLIARDLRDFYKAACNIPECDFIIIGDSDVKLQSQDNIKVIDRESPDIIEEYVKKTDVLVCLMNSKGNQVPGKVYHYAGSDKEIMFIKDGEYGDQIETFFSKYNRYTFVNNSAEDIEKVIRNYIEKGIPERRPVEEFRADYIAAELIRNI